MNTLSFFRLATELVGLLELVSVGILPVKKQLSGKKKEQLNAPVQQWAGGVLHPPCTTHSWSLMDLLNR